MKLLNDRFGIQVRGGCSCAGTYGHYLLEVDQERSNKVTSAISAGILDNKPGWIRLSIHPTMTNEEVYFIIDALRDLASNHKEWASDYHYDNRKNEFYHKQVHCSGHALVDKWFGTQDSVQRELVLI